MLRRLLLFLVCLSLVQSGAVAPAVSTTTACICPVPACIAPPICVRGLVTTSDPSSNACENIHICRTLFSIIQTCVLTIFACIWVAVHRNIPGPTQGWISVHLQWLMVVVLTLLVPEWILAWAVRQFLRARKLVMRLEEARVSAKEDWEKKHEIRVGQTYGEKESNDGEEEECVNEFGMGEREDEIPLTRRHPTQIDIGTAGAPGGDAPNTLAMAARLARINEPWTTVHAFFIIMGGFHFYDGEPLYPLSAKDVLALVRCGALVPPTSKELNDRSKGDGLSKGLAILQTLWFVMQCIARRIEHLPITSLEVMTLAYAVITVAMYAAWWHKPLNISCAVPVPGTAAEKVDADSRSSWEGIFYYVLGTHDEMITLSQEQRVPTFWADCTNDEESDVFIADTIALAVAMVFGAVHCVAWSYTFPSHMEQFMWRLSVISIVAVPMTMLLTVVIVGVIQMLSEGLGGLLGVATYGLCAIIYIGARIILLVLSFTTLRSLPFTAYQTVQWTTFIPHI